MSPLRYLCANPHLQCARPSGRPPTTPARPLLRACRSRSGLASDASLLGWCEDLHGLRPCARTRVFSRFSHRMIGVYFDKTNESTIIFALPKTIARTAPRLDCSRVARALSRCEQGAIFALAIVRSIEYRGDREVLNMTKLRDYMASVGMNQTEVAEAIGISIGHLSDVLNAKKPASFDLAVRISAWTRGALQPADLIPPERMPAGAEVQVRPSSPVV